jgi:hypothetical protein
VSCTGGTTTSVSGTVMAPNGIDPVPEAAVYVPRDVPEFPSTVQCEACNDPIGGNPIVQVLTTVDGKFKLENVPATSQVPIIVQKGRFRRKILLDVTACQDHPLTIDQARLPKNQQEGDLPKIAVGVGNFDQIECVLRAIGIDQSEFTAPTGNGAVHLYGNGASGLSTPKSTEMSALLGDMAKLSTYNLVFLNCTGAQWDALTAKAQITQNLLDYVSAGGRLYATDWSYDFIEQVSSFSPYMNFSGGGPAMSPQTPHAAATGQADMISAHVSDPHLLDWLRVAAPSHINGTDGVTIQDLLPEWVLLDAISTDMNYPATTWVHGNADGKDRPLSVTFDFNSCGKVLFSSYHTREPGGINALSGQKSAFPSYCKSTSTSMIAQEKILEYLIFHISSCVGPIG